MTNTRADANRDHEDNHHGHTLTVTRRVGGSKVRAGASGLMVTEHSRRRVGDTPIASNTTAHAAIMT